ncbi:MAG: ribonuclease PH [Candidatus Krumholzibacteriota bacterium]|nr:ribonuclease PH [Candidatus Krumholzibacteriota bacterium]
MSRRNRRKRNELRPINITLNYIKSSPASVLFEMGNTRVLCTATVEDSVPPFLRGAGKGWITAEYGMLPRSSTSRISRESVRGRVKGRTHEIQRLIGRSLRSVVDLEKIGERTIIIDCDVIEADGGTRTASINGGFIALAEVLRRLRLEKTALRFFTAAVSVGVVEEKICLDLDYSEDARAAVDMNVVMNDRGQYIEIQGTGEEAVFSQEELSAMLQLARTGIRKIIREQKKGLGWA